MAFDMKSVENSKSGNIKAAGYDPTTETMRVEFAGGKQYDYHGVDDKVWAAFNEAPSAGEYLNKVVKVGCPAALVEEEGNE